MSNKSPIAFPPYAGETPDLQELKVNRLTFVRLSKQPIMVKFKEDEYCILSEIDAQNLYEMLKEHLGK